jgi:hypothetical protein
MGAVWTMQASQIEPFVVSLRRTGFAGRVCIVAARLDPTEAEAIAALVDELILVDDLYPRVAPRPLVRALHLIKHTRGTRRHYPWIYRLATRIPTRAGKAALITDLEFRLQGLQSLRYRHYADRLSRGDDVDRVLISDVRDVIFQDDPFKWISSELEVFLEDDHETLGAPGFNSTWIRDLYGDSVLRSFGENTVSCSGVTGGTRRGVARYSDAVAAELRRFAIPLGPHDQAAHNWLLRSGRLPEACVRANRMSGVFTVSVHSPPSLSADEEVLNADGSLPAVVHQYDRLPSLHEALLLRLVDR